MSIVNFDLDEPTRQVFLSKWELEALIKMRENTAVVGDERMLRMLRLGDKLGTALAKFGEQPPADPPGPDATINKSVEQGPAKKRAKRQKAGPVNANGNGSDPGSTA